MNRIIRETGKKVDNDKFPITSASKRRYKETEAGQQAMTEIMERIVKEEREEEKDLVNKLKSILIDMDRFDDVKRATKDKAYQMQLMIELLPEEI